MPGLALLGPRRPCEIGPRIAGQQEVDMTTHDEIETPLNHLPDGKIRGLMQNY